MFLSFRRLFLKTIGRIIPSDYFSYRYPVSAKGVCFIDNKVVLLQNERREWDLPGGKLKKGEDIAQCLAREIKEELDISVRVGRLLQATKVRVLGAVEVLVLIYSCPTGASAHDLKLSYENFALRLFSIDELPDISLPREYRQAIRQAFYFHTLGQR